MLLRLIARHGLASFVNHVLRGAALLVLVLGAAPVSSGELGDPLSTAIKARSEQTGEKFILTRKALSKEKKIGARALLDSQSRSAVIRGWTVIYLPEEDVSAIERRAEQNQRIWEPMLVGQSLPKNSAMNELPGIDVALVAAMFSHSCGISLEFNFKQPIYVFIYDTKGTPIETLCRDYMLILAVNGIVVNRNGHRLMADLVKE